MFLRRVGRKIVLLHSYRDGSGRVCQLRLADVEEELALECFRNQSWRGELEERFSDIRMDWRRLRERLELLLEDVAPRQRRARTRQILVETRLRDLLRALQSETDERVLKGVAEAVQHRLDCTGASLQRAEKKAEAGDLDAAERELRALVVRTRAELPARRSRFSEKEPPVKSYLQAQERLAEVLRQQGRLKESLEVQRARVNCCATREARLDLGSALQRQGELEAAAREYARAPRRFSWRHYNLAAVALEREHWDEALEHLFQGFWRGREIVFALKHLRAGRKAGWGREYWEWYGHLWNEQARDFLLATRAEPLVGVQVSNALECGRMPRRCVEGRARQLLLERIQSALNSR